MNKTFVLNSSLSSLEVHDAIQERVVKAKGIASSLLFVNFSEGMLSSKSLYGAIWAIDGLLDEVDFLCNVMGK